MGMIQATLIDKKALTNDVFELHYKLSEKKEMLAGQFFTFILPGIGGRSYSALDLKGDHLVLIIKRWETGNGWRWWSILLCDAEIGTEYKCVGPAGHFVLQESNDNKLFLWTWTGLVPLYNMILEWLKRKSGEKYQLVFGVRYTKDFYYIGHFEALKTKYPETFYYHLVVSREDWEAIIQKGYVTDFLTQNTVKQYSEFYLCGAPAMIEWCQEKLTELEVHSENVYFEKYA